MHGGLAYLIVAASEEGGVESKGEEAGAESKRGGGDEEACSSDSCRFAKALSGSVTNQLSGRVSPKMNDAVSERLGDSVGSGAGNGGLLAVILDLGLCECTFSRRRSLGVNEAIVARS